MEKLIHLDLYDGRRDEDFADIECRECAYFGHTCANAVVVLEAMRSRGNDMSIPVFDFTPDGDRNASQCPGMWPSRNYLRNTAQDRALELAEQRSAAQHQWDVGSVKGYGTGGL
ncbi:hypothetical protein SAMN04488503_2217 [Humidesulfovibrio mexicanus]|uniref:Uncharacterized protein n=1 Tax=Humidesulfovibrio mexicanus TaxID=147047 RepID=A0A239ATK8_9BACT|nr:hypothetical protein [Humidesulfovibrio mexicanus]SNR99036.1 hypothetical protein SAMN04488503_2217 [Humidesulfovibrio mexicanus]